MSVIKVTLPVGEIPVSGKQISFTAPCSCKDTEALEIDGARYTVVDALCRPVTGVGGRWDVGAIVSVILDTDKKYAFYQNSWTPTAADVGAVPTTRKVNGKALSSDISLVAADVGARPNTWMPTAADVGAAPALERAKHVQGNPVIVSAKGWYRIATMYTLDSALFCVGNSYTSGGPSRLLFYVYPNNVKSGVVVLSNTVPNVNIITNIRVVGLGGSLYGVDVHYNRDGKNTMYASAVAFSVSGRSNFSMVEWTAATDGTELCAVTVRNMPSGMVLTSGNTYKELGLFPRFKKVLTKEDDLDDFIDDGIIVYNTLDSDDQPDAPVNAPYPNASVGICFGSDDTTRQHIQLVMRYGAPGYMRFRCFTGSKWTEWADVYTSVHKPAVADIADGNNLSRIETGSYVGTGTCGVNCPTEITFGFVPKIVWVWDEPRGDRYNYGIGSVGSGYMIPCASLTDQYSIGRYLDYASNRWYNKVVETTLSFYYGDPKYIDEETGEQYYPGSICSAQLNAAGETYHYMAIG